MFSLRLGTLVVFSTWLTHSLCGSLTSSSWRKPNVTTSLTDRVNIAGAAVDKGISMLGSDAQFDGQPWGVAGNFYSQMADYDIATNQTKYEASLKSYFLQASQLRNNFSDEAAYGHAAVRAYAAYKDPVFLDYAIQSWWFGRFYTLSSQEVSSGSSGAKSFPIEGNCQGSESFLGCASGEALIAAGAATMTGGTFWNTITDQPALNALGTGYFLTVSALLAEATSDPMYLQAATEAADFFHDHLLNARNEVQDTISARANDSCSDTSNIEPYNSGLMIEGLSILYSITGNATVQELLNDVLAAAIPNNAWQGSNGIIDNGGSGDLNLVQGLTAVYTRNATTPDIHADLEQYIAVQFNAVLDLATANESNVYGNAWVGPPSSVFSGLNQTNALSALIGVINLRNASETTVSGTTPSASMTHVPPSPPPAQNKSSRNDVQVAIIAGVFGGVAFVAIAGGVWAVRRRLSSKRAIPTDGGVRSRPPAAALEGQSTTTRHPSSLPTHMLVRILNERLQGHEWDDGEAPPEYPV
ncbi:hypothetical protein B0H11DRAFT_2254320 [Mycena galericulata]|nr:hypothetical protein B0H11DRAFT_2254320 [Mycena galericulata]